MTETRSGVMDLWYNNGVRSESYDLKAFGLQL